MYSYFLVAIGSMLGGTLRFWLSGLIANSVGWAFPLGTLLVNITGSIAIGFFSTLTGPEGRVLVPGPWRQFFMVGVCGGYTTFSSFSLQTLDLIRAGAMTRAMINIVVSVVLCVAATACGHLIAAHFNDGASRIAQTQLEEDA